MHALSYLGGLIDGEGCFTLKKSRNAAYTPVFALASTSKVIIESVRKVLDENNIVYNLTHSDREDGSKPYTTLAVNGSRQIKPLLELVSDYVLEKKPQLIVLQEFIEIRSQYGMNNMPWELTDHLIEKIRELNKRGI